MNIFKNVPKYNFFGKTTYFAGLSGFLILAGLISVFTKGFNLGVDFEGGTLIQLKFEEPVSLEALRGPVEKNFPQGASISRFGEEENNEVIIQISGGQADGGVGTNFQKMPREGFPKFDIRRIETVGPKIGEELKIKAIYSVLTALFGILIYTAFRFKFVYGIGALLALFHDVLITLGIFSIFELELDLSIVAALLTIVGYSLNDTIVVFDRIRENLVKLNKLSFIDLINKSINETLNRTIMTAVSTFLVVFVLFLLGGEIIKVFSLSLCIGIIVGTYSSIFIACPMVYFLQKTLLKKG